MFSPDKLSPSNYLEMRNRRIIECKALTSLPKPVRDFKARKAAALVKSAKNAAVSTTPVETAVEQSSKGPITVTVCKADQPPLNAVIHTMPKVPTHNKDSNSIVQSPCAEQIPPGNVPLPQFTSFLQAATGGHTDIKYLFPNITLDRKVLFGDNFNYKFPTSPMFPAECLVSHFVCTQVSPIEVEIIVPADFVAPDGDQCVAITINDVPFMGCIVPFDLLRSTLYSSYQ